MKKIFYVIGIPFTIVGILLWLSGLPFILIAKKFGHTYWRF